MADIKQAAKWMQEKKIVRRKAWPQWVIRSIGGDGVIVLDRNESDASNFELIDLLANDWEIAD